MARKMTKRKTFFKFPKISEEFEQKLALVLIVMAFAFVAMLFRLFLFPTALNFPALLDSLIVGVCSGAMVGLIVSETIK